MKLHVGDWCQSSPENSSSGYYWPLCASDRMSTLCLGTFRTNVVWKSETDILFSVHLLRKSHFFLFSVLSFRSCDSCRRLPEPQHHSFLFNHWFASKCLVFMAAPTPSIHVFLGRPLFLLSPGIHSIINFGSLSSCILLTWPYHWSLFLSMMRRQKWNLK